MATAGTPYEGRDNHIGPAVYTSSLQLGLYANTGDSLDSDTVLADLTQPSGTGYALITLNGVWAFNNGVVTYDHGTPDNPRFTNSDASKWTNGDIVGAFITDGTYVVHFKDFTQVREMIVGAVLEVDVSTLI